MSLQNLRIVTVRYDNQSSNSFNTDEDDTTYHLEYADMNKLVVALLELHELSFSRSYNRLNRLKYVYTSTPVESTFASNTDTIKIINNWNNDIIYMSSEMHAKYVVQADADYTYETGPVSKVKNSYEIGPYLHVNYLNLINLSMDKSVSTMLYRPNDYDPPKIY